jgi:hypothetical protein
MARTIVVSDLHGQKRLLVNALAHAEFEPTVDTLVVAGDTCDIGGETMQVHEMLFDLGAIQLVGNHEISHLCRIDIRPYDVGLDPDYIAFIGLGIDMGEFKMAHEVDGVLISHAGLSKRLAMTGLTAGGKEDSSLSTHYHSGTLSAAIVAKHFNERLKSRVHIDHELLLLDVDGDPMWTDWFYPFWFRPYDYQDQGPVERCGFFDGFKQVVGHTPVGSFTSKQQRLIAQSQVSLIDPYARKHFGLDGYCRYAVIENGEVTVHVNLEG